MNEAAQTYAMLGAAGLTGGSGVSFLQGLEGNLQQVFTPQVGTGALSQQAIELQSLGITQKDITSSPWELLNTIGVRYRSLLSQGRGQQASELLSLTGTSQVAPLLQNWNAMQSQMSGINFNMSPSQLNNAVKQNVTMQGSMQKLSIAFDQLSLAITPFVEKLTQALDDLSKGLAGTNGSHGAGGFFKGVGNAASALGSNTRRDHWWMARFKRSRNGI